MRKEQMDIPAGAVQVATVSERLREVMAENAENATSLSNKIGVHRSSVSRYLAGIMLPKHAPLSAMAEVLGVSETWLRGFNTPKY